MKPGTAAVGCQFQRLSRFYRQNSRHSSRPAGRADAMIESVPWPAPFPTRQFMVAFPAASTVQGCKRAIRWGGIALLMAGVFSPTTASAIEMFTFFGDGSRVPLPSLETPIEAYPGIPLRSDRLRARRRAQRMVPQPAARPAAPGGISIRAMPTFSAPDPDVVFQPAPTAEAVPTPTPAQPRLRRWRR